MLISSLRLLVGAAAAASTLAATLPTAEAQPNNREDCFRLSHLNNSKLADDNHVLYLRVYGNQYYRMDFGGSCNRSGNEPLIFHPFDNNDLICRPVDLDVSVRATHEGCIPTSLKKLTADEVAAIPPADRP
jgi:hypothetical protein